ncbi:MAG: regulatory protein RecX [Candidatus Omnitrophota bacterium]|nr:recombination regulator RecX [Candidatus Omnitrophota bacterium]MBU1929759.1 recombination regulator RecX [Candidatus Omnitrophota bacterium]MBU2035413.1 recombination regulator RecX [Candidatus Omnitrophota bacterium]
MENKNLSPLEKAKRYAFFLLKFRLRSEKEIYQRLKKKCFPEGDIQKVVVFLKSKNFINDLVFAKAWVDSRVKKPIGARRLKTELKIKGIQEGIIDEQIERVKKEYPQDMIALELAKSRFTKLKSVEPQKARVRVYGFLIRRGFSPDVVIDVLNNIKPDQKQDQVPFI